VSVIRDPETKDGWRLRAASLDDIGGLHALAAIPLVYRYLFDGVPPDKEFIARAVAQSVANVERGGSACDSWKMLPRDTPVVSNYDPIHPPDPQKSSTC
jgi:hypothetical protein